MYEPWGISDPPLAPEAPLPIEWILTGLELAAICLNDFIEIQVNAAPVSYNQVGCIPGRVLSWISGREVCFERMSFILITSWHISLIHVFLIKLIKELDCMLLILVSLFTELVEMSGLFCLVVWMWFTIGALWESLTSFLNWKWRKLEQPVLSHRRIFHLHFVVGPLGLHFWPYFWLEESSSLQLCALAFCSICTLVFALADWSCCSELASTVECCCFECYLLCSLYLGFRPCLGYLCIVRFIVKIFIRNNSNIGNSI